MRGLRGLHLAHGLLRDLLTPSHTAVSVDAVDVRVGDRRCCWVRLPLRRFQRHIFVRARQPAACVFGHRPLPGVTPDRPAVAPYCRKRRAKHNQGNGLRRACEQLVSACCAADSSGLLVGNSSIRLPHSRVQARLIRKAVFVQRKKHVISARLMAREGQYVNRSAI